MKISQHPALTSDPSILAADKLAQVAVQQPMKVDTVYRRFFVSAIIITVTLGAGWGTWLLWGIAQARSFTGISIHAINAHGQAQIYGWLGLFIMGFAYQAFPRLWKTPFVNRKVANTVLVLMILGILIRSVAMAMPGRAHMADLASIGGVLELIAILLFTAQIFRLWRSSQNKLQSAHVAFVLAALGFFILQGAFDVWHTYMTMSAADKGELVWYISTYQDPLRDLQIHGLALFMILGMSMEILPRMFQMPRIKPGRAWSGFAVLMAAVIGEIAIFLTYRMTGNHVLAAFLMIPWLMLLIGIWLIAGPWRLWKPAVQTNRSSKFVRAAYAWLLVAMVMLLLLPVDLKLTGLPFSHAYYGAIRHAVTVGFISLMIMGLGALVVPTISAISTAGLSGLWGPFILINIGCFMRVSLEVLSDWYHSAYHIIGISGLLELTAIAWWGWHIIKLIHQAAAREAQQTAGTITSRVY